MTLAALEVRNTSDSDISRQPVCAGVPLCAGSAWRVGELVLRENDHIDPVFQLSEMNRWPDGSLRWVLVECLVSLKARSCLDITLVRSSADVPQREIKTSPSSKVWHLEPSAMPAADDTSRQEGINVVDTRNELIVDTGLVQFSFPKDAQTCFPTASTGSVAVWPAHGMRAVLADSTGSEAELKVSTVRLAEGSGPHRVSVVVHGVYDLPETRQKLALQMQFSFFASSSWVTLETTLHNSAAARHPGGLWDLGDDGSVLFSDFSLEMSLDARQRVSLEVDDEADRFSRADVPLSLYQASSGGTNWNSAAHMDFKGEIPCQFRGYRLLDSLNESISGLRASPGVSVTGLGAGWSMWPERFWQNCPKAIDLTGDKCSLRLFPRQFAAGFELQGGEQKSHKTHFKVGQDGSALLRPCVALHVGVPRSVLAAAGTFPYMDSESIDSEYDELVSLGVAGSNNFFVKRESIDEYGWRNFGELPADHEALYSSKTNPFISHYNNQYDPIYGFARQYALTARSEWFELMRDLANHVMDIDIYRTEHDRAEYNGGLFWHTEHYTEAFTCTHRTYSRLQANAQSPQGSGGGPGGEHCYTTGLACYYFLTGERKAKDTVLLMTDWITRYYEGSGALSGQLVTMLKRDLPDLVAVMRGQKRYRYKYPLSRGTGNYLNALLDSFDLTGEAKYLQQAHAVLQNTIGPSDDIARRNFDDIETTWFYTVFLQVLGKYLDTKCHLGQFDSAFHHARCSLLHYAKWMVANECPYLERSERLEYPNDTWVAQDIRKANVLLIAHMYREDDSVDFLAKARDFRKYVIRMLQGSAESQLTRVLAILMQNHGPASILASRADTDITRLTIPCSIEPVQQCTGDWTASSLSRHILKTISGGLFGLSPRREWAWLRPRLSR